MQNHSTLSAKISGIFSKLLLISFALIFINNKGFARNESKGNFFSCTLVKINPVVYHKTNVNTAIDSLVDSLVVIQPQAPNICSGSSVTLSVPLSGSKYTWYPATGLNTTTGNSVIATPTVTTTYTVYGLDSFGYPVTGTDVVTVGFSEAINSNGDTICAGSSVLLTASGGTSYLWSNGANTDTTTVAPLKDSIYSVLISNGTCNITDSISIVVTTSFSFNIEPLSPIICFGTGVWLHASGGGKGATYTWSPATGLNTTTGDSVYANPTISTTYTATGSDGCVSTFSDDLTVIAAPNKPIITKSITGDTLHSSASNSNQWYFDDSIIPGATDSIYTSLLSGCYTVVVTDIANGCSTSSDSLCIGSGALIIQPQSPSVCSGQSVMLTVPASGSNYVWSPDTAINTITGDSVVVAPTITTTYTVTGLDSLGTYVSGTDVVTVLTGPNKPPIITVHYDTLFSSEASGNQWFRNDSLLAGATAQFYVAHIDGWYYDVIDSGCNSMSDSTYIGAPGNLVWPGDANDDLTANYNDLISIGLYYGNTGTARDSISNTWVGQSSANWNSLQYDGIDKKYADCNGDGVINSDDTLAITLNFGKHHSGYVPRASRSTNGTVPLSIIADSSSYHAGSIVHARLMLGSSANPASDIYGLAYAITVDNAIVEPGTLTFNYDNTSFFGTKNLYVLTLANIGDDVETAVTGIDHINRTGSGKIGDLYFTLSNNISNSQQALSISSYEAVDNNGVLKALLPVNDTVTVATGIAPVSINNNQVSIYPNPSTGKITVAAAKNMDEVKVTNVLGQLVYEAQPNQKQLIFELKNEGMYFVAVTSSSETITQKVIVTR